MPAAGSCRSRRSLSGTLAAHQLTGAEPDRLVFTTRQGRPIDYSHWRERVWLPAVAAAGVAGAGFHDLRRADATTLVAEGVNVKTAQTRLGHADPRTTPSGYAQAVPSADRAAAKAFGHREIAHGSRTGRPDANRPHHEDGA